MKTGRMFVLWVCFMAACTLSLGLFGIYAAREAGYAEKAYESSRDYYEAELWCMSSALLWAEDEKTPGAKAEFSEAAGDGTFVEMEASVDADGAVVLGKPVRTFPDVWEKEELRFDARTARESGQQ